METFVRFAHKKQWTQWGFTVKLAGLFILLFCLWHIIPYTIQATELRAFPHFDDLDWILLGLILVFWHWGRNITFLYKAKKTFFLCIALVIAGIGIVLFLDFNAYYEPIKKLEDKQRYFESISRYKDPQKVFYNPLSDQWKKIESYFYIEKSSQTLNARLWNLLSPAQLLTKEELVILNPYFYWQKSLDKGWQQPKVLIKNSRIVLRQVFNALYGRRFSEIITGINRFAFLYLPNQVLGKKPENLKDMRAEIALYSDKDKKQDSIEKKQQLREESQKQNLEASAAEDSEQWIPWLGLSHRSMNHVQLSNAVLPFTDFENNNLRYSNFSNSRLSGSRLDNAHLEHANLFLVHLDHARLYDTNLEHANLFFAHLEHASLFNAHLEHASLDAANLEHASLDAAHLEHTSLDDAHLEHASLDGAFLQYASLSGAFLQYASLYNAHLEHANLSETVFKGAALEGADLRNCYFDFKENSHGDYILDQYHNLIPDYSKGGKNLCDAKKLARSIVDKALKQRLMAICPEKANRMKTE
jgi:uncharacterized protein YjbI with pentapeptide repeats